MASPTSSRAEATRAALIDAALAELSAFGFRRSSMESVARRAGVSRATVYVHWKSKQELLRGVVQHLHDEHLHAMERVLEAGGDELEARILAVLEARFLLFVELTSQSPHAAELYDLHSRVCGDIAQASQQRSERVLARLVREADAAGELDLAATGLSAARTAAVLFDCAHGAKGEDPSLSTPREFRERLARIVRVLVVGLRPTPR